MNGHSTGLRTGALTRLRKKARFDSFAYHNSRVSNDGGIELSVKSAQVLLANDSEQWFFNPKYLCISPELFGYKTRTSAPYTYATKVYSANYPQSGTGNDLTQSTANSQPYLSKIAPSEPQALLNTNGDSRYLSHSVVSFATNEKWTYEVVLDWNGGTSSIIGLTYGAVTINQDIIGLRYTTNRLWFKGATGGAILTPEIPFNSWIGKKTVIHYVCIGGSILVYVNGIYQNTLVGATDVKLSALFTNSATSTANGKIHHYSIIPDALSASRIAYRAALLRSIFAEIPTVRVAGLDVAVRSLDIAVTPAGNIIPEMQLASNTEKITNTDNRTFTNWANVTWIAYNSSTISDGSGKMMISLANVNQSGALLYVSGATAGKWYKIKMDVWKNTAAFSNYFMQYGSVTKTITINNVQTTYETYIQATSTNSAFLLAANGTPDVGSIYVDNASCDEVGWSGLTDLYNGLIARGTSAANAQLAAMAWCHHSNDLAYGSVYGKLYNGYARTTIKSDLLSSSYGYHIATEAELTAIAASGLALKSIGTGFWTTANGTNVSGLTLLGGASRNTDGTFATIKGSTMFWCGDSDKCLTMLDDGTVSIGVKDLKTGAYILLIKNY